MRNKETGEFELLVGNAQILSGFFILLLLLAVTFMMGYVVGQNSPHSAKVLTETAPASTGAPDARQQAAGPQSQPAAVQPAATSGDAAAPAASTATAAETQPQPTTQPAREASGSAPASAAATAPAAAASDATSSSYWQLGAWKEPKTADVLASSLKEQGFPAFVKLDANGLSHVMVGPYDDAQAMGRAKTELQSRFGLKPYLIRK